MARKWFQGTVRYDRCAENGAIKKVSEQYVVEAVNFTDAEAGLLTELTPYVSGEIVVKQLKPSNFTEVLTDAFHLASSTEAFVGKATGSNTNLSEEPDKWFSVKINLITLDEKTAKEKKTPCYYLVHANTTQAAQRLVENHMKGSVSDYTIERIVETKVLEVFAYSTKEKASK